MAVEPTIGGLPYPSSCTSPIDQISNSGSSSSHLGSLSTTQLLLAAYDKTLADERVLSSQQKHIAELEVQLEKTTMQAKHARDEASKWRNAYTTLGTAAEDERKFMDGIKDERAKLQMRYDELEQSHKTLETYKATTARQVMGWSVAIDHLTSQIERRDCTVRHLRAEHDDHIGKALTSQSTVFRLRSEIEELDDKALEQRKELDGLRKKQASLVESNDEQRKTIASLRNNNNVAINQKRELEHELDVARKQNEDKIRALRDDLEEKARTLTKQHQTSLRQLQSTNSAVSGDLLKLTDDNANLKRQTSNNEAEIARLLAANKKLQDDLAAAQIACRKAVRDVDSQPRTIELLRDRLERSANENDDLGKQHAGSMAKILQLELKLKCAGEKIGRLQKDLELEKARATLLRRTEETLSKERAESAVVSRALNAAQKEAHMLQVELAGKEEWAAKVRSFLAREKQQQQEREQLLGSGAGEQAGDAVKTQSTPDYKTTLWSPVTPVLKHQSRSSLGSNAEALPTSSAMQAIPGDSVARKQSGSHELPCFGRPSKSRDPRLARRGGSLAVSGTKRSHDVDADEIVVAKPTKKIMHG